MLIFTSVLDNKMLFAFHAVPKSHDMGMSQHGEDCTHLGEIINLIFKVYVPDDSLPLHID